MIISGTGRWVIARDISFQVVNCRRMCRDEPVYYVADREHPFRLFGQIFSGARLRTLEARRASERYKEARDHGIEDFATIFPEAPLLRK
jgi:hypothetical protein